jgi:hypothetical protein
MRHSTRKILAICVTVAVAAASTLLVVGSITGTHAQSSLASGISSATDYAVPAGSDPWGTAFDSSGRVWVALPGCDLAPSCPTTTPPGKLALFDPTANNWTTIVSLPAGYGQPLFVAVDQTGNVWFTMPVTNTIGMYDPVSTTVTQWAVPTPSAGPWGIALDSKGTIYTSPTAQSHPHDGLTVDSQNRVWFDEEFAHKLAEAIPSTSPTPTPTTSPTSTPTSTPTPMPGAILGTDTFQRANRSLWGTASDGQTWGGDANSQSVFSLSGNAGLVSNTGATSYSAVLGPQASNAEVYATGSLSSFSNSNFGDVLRWTDGNNWYKAYIDGSSLIMQKKVSGVTTILASVPFSAAAGSAYTIHFRVVGATLTANVWASAGAEPGGWMVTASDSTLTSGYCGMRLLTQSGTATVTSFQAKSL